MRYIKHIGWTFAIISICAHISNHIFSVSTNVWLSVWSSNTNSTDSGERNKYLIVYGLLGTGEGL